MDPAGIASICKALSDTNRLQIIEILAGSDEKCARDILEKFKITQPTLSHHMKILAECGLVSSRKDGKWNHYSVNKKTLKEFRKYIKNLCRNEEKKSKK